MSGAPARLRAATEADLPEVFAIYDEEVLHGTATFDTQPRTPAERLDWFRSDGAGRYPVLVAEVDGRVAAWARLYAWSPRRAYDRTAEDAVYVDRAQRGRGLGRALLAALMREAPPRGIHVLLARVVEGNPASRALHEALGFRSVGVMRRVGEKFGRLLDVRLMERHLDEPGRE